MGLRLFPGSAGGGVAVEDEALISRFGAYFPRVFAYVHHSTGDEGTTRELVTEAFTRVFSRCGELCEDEFRLALFRTARDLMRRACVPPQIDDSLTERERDLLSLLFDALLDRGEVASLLDIQEEAMTVELVRALKKLRSGMGQSMAPSFLRAF